MSVIFGNLASFLVDDAKGLLESCDQMLQYMADPDLCDICTEEDTSLVRSIRSDVEQIQKSLNGLKNAMETR